MKTSTFTFENYRRVCEIIVEYDESKDYEDLVRQHLAVLSGAIEDMEDCQTSRYKSIFDEVNLEEYYNIDRSVLDQAMYGYIDPSVELSNPEWFRVMRMVLLNYKIIICVFTECDLTVTWPRNDIHTGNACLLADNLKCGFEHINGLFFNKGDDWPKLNIIRVNKVKGEPCSVDLSYGEPLSYGGVDSTAGTTTDCTL
jgi:hypothetical protein